MKEYLAFITPQVNPEGERSMLITNSKLEKSLYMIQGYRPDLFDRIFIKGIPGNKKKFYKLIFDTFARKPFILNGELEKFCDKYNFIFEKLPAA